jgi:hypothetical protein
MLEQVDADSAPKKNFHPVPVDRDRFERLSVGVSSCCGELRPMLFYADLERWERPGTLLQSIGETVRKAGAASPGLERHRTLVQAFIQAGELVQGWADAEFDRLGLDDISDAQVGVSRLLLGLAHAVLGSWSNQFGGVLDLADDWKAGLVGLDNLTQVRLKRAEGYAFYSLYPESYLEAALRSRLGKDTVVIGLRSIGAGLAALVAAAIGADRIFTLRPVGQPFERRLAIGPALSQTILADPEAAFAVVDEGPGLSGSSFGCVCDWLVASGVDPRRIHFFPSHVGDLGPKASEAHRSLWRSVTRHVVSADEAVLARRKAPALADWAAAVVGKRVDDWQEISGGAWRAHHYSSSTFWPPVHAGMERRKFLMRAEDRICLGKFVGLDVLASRRLGSAAALAEGGFVPPQLGVTYGFAFEEWVRASPADVASIDNVDLIDRVARYLIFRAGELAPSHGGATFADLCAMAVINTGEAFGSDAGDRMRKRLGNIGRIARSSRPFDTDNRMHRWEWLVTPSGRLLKADAIDHNAAHDLVGCQDIAWDIAGATVEFGLSDKDRIRLVEHVTAQVDVDLGDEKLRSFEYCYVAFQIGLWSFASAAASDEERHRIAAAVRRYRGRLQMLLDR